MGNVTEQLLEGMDVYDVDGFKVGKVVKYDLTLGYVETLGAFTDPRFIPFVAIEKIGPSGAYLNVTKEVVSDIYDHLPRVTPDLTPGGRLTGTGTLASGHTGRPVPLDAEGLRIVHEKIHNGTTVLDADDRYLGKIQAYDGSTGYMRIEKDGLAVKNIFLPVTSVSFLDDDGIHLS
jgi:hypothetical protein